MATIKDFKVGDPVKHMGGNIGKVTAIKEDGAVCVTYDHGKDYWKGEYDDLWFRLHPDGLTKLDASIR